MANVRTQAKSIGYGNSATARTLAFPSNVTAGNFIVVCVSTFNTGITVAVTDSLGNTYTQAGSYVVNGTTRASMFYAMNIAGGACTVTVTQSATCFMDFAILEYSGIVTTSALDAVSAGSTGTSATPNADSVAVNQAGDLIVACFARASAFSSELCVIDGVCGVGAVNNDLNSPIIVLDCLSSDAAITPSFRANSLAYAALAASFKTASAPSGGGNANPKRVQSL